MADDHWVAWHDPYDRPGSSLHRRLRVVQQRVRDALDAAAPGPIRVVSMCAGQGRDLLEVLPHHARRDDVRARLVELDATNVEHARAAVTAAGLADVEVVQGDASTTAAYVGAVPADLVLACGIFGNVSDADIATTVQHLPELCAPAATVIWTRHRGEPDLTPAIRRWFVEAGFDEVAFDAEDGFAFGVGTARLAVEPPPLGPPRTLFQFVGDGTLGHV